MNKLIKFSTPFLFVFYVIINNVISVIISNNYKDLYEFSNIYPLYFYSPVIVIMVVSLLQNYFKNNKLLVFIKLPINIIVATLLLMFSLVNPAPTNNFIFCLVWTRIIILTFISILIIIINIIEIKKIIMLQCSNEVG